jgi:hypothetical protein
MSKLYCHCKKEAYGTMVQCESRCGEWYHLDCIDMTEKQIDKIDKYICKNCIKIQIPLNTGKIINNVGGVSKIKNLLF